MDRLSEKVRLLGLLADECEADGDKATAGGIRLSASSITRHRQEDRELPRDAASALRRFAASDRGNAIGANNQQQWIDVAETKERAAEILEAS